MNTDVPTILVATDGSAHSRRILRHAESFGRVLGARLTLGQVLVHKDVAEEPGESEAAAVARVRDAMITDLRNVLKRLGIEGSALVMTPREDEPLVADVIASRAADINAVMIAMDTRGYGAVHHVIQGSVALDVLKQTPLPVMLSGVDIGDPPVVTGAYRILIANDGSPASGAVVQQLAPLLKPERFEVTLLTVHEREAERQTEAEETAAAQAHLHSLRSAFPSGVNVDAKVRTIVQGAGIDTAILEEAESFGAHAIAASTHGTNIRRHLLAGSTALQLLSRSPLPVIMARSA